MNSTLCNANKLNYLANIKIVSYVSFDIRGTLLNYNNDRFFEIIINKNWFAIIIVESRGGAANSIFFDNY